jgi:hypothetical protein
VLKGLFSPPTLLPRNVGPPRSRVSPTPTTTSRPGSALPAGVAPRPRLGWSRRTIPLSPWLSVVQGNPQARLNQ